METMNADNGGVIRTSAGYSYNKGWNILWKCFIELLVVTIIYSIIQIPTGMIRFDVDELDEIHKLAWMFVPIVFFGIAYAVFIAGPIGYSVKWVFLKAVRGQKIEIKDMFAVFNRNYWNAVIASLVTGVIIIFGLIMLIFPGIIFACRLAFVPYLVIDRKMETMEALKTSWEMTKGHAWSIFFIGLLAIPIFLAGFIMLFFGVFISVMWIGVAFAVIYHHVCLKRGEGLPVEQEVVS